MKLPDIIPWWWKAGAAAALVAALYAGHRYQVSAAYADGHAAAVSERSAADLVAVVGRVHENAAITIKQDSINATITKADNEEMASLRARLAAAERMRKPAFCNGPAAPAQAEGVASSNPPDPAGGLVPERVEQDIQALIMRTEEVASTARACQSFIRENGLVP